MKNYTKVNDSRISGNEEKEIFTFSAEEKETHLTFDYEQQQWIVYSNVPSHITKLLKLKKNNLKVETVTESGAIASISGTLKPSQVSFRNITELTEEQKRERALRAKERFSTCE